MASTATALRYVPQGPVSLSTDAPGWSVNVKNNNEQKGPTCWKCKGLGFLPPLARQKRQKGRKKDSTADAAPSHADADTQQNRSRTCPVCNGKGHLPIRSKYLQSKNDPGAITSRRCRPRGWKEFGHIPPAVQATLASSEDSACGENHSSESENDDTKDKMIDRAVSLLFQANGRDGDYETKRKDVPVRIHCQNVPQWLPSNPGEQLCNLVGRWRILQRVASHRWTTDDLVTAFVAASTFVSSQRSNSTNITENRGERTTIRYLDLGTGNASVLQMATWYLLSSLQGERYKLEAVGVEARSEAAGLARRSLSFNLGAVRHKQNLYTGSLDTAGTASMEHDVHIVQGDFRDLVSLSSDTREKTPSVLFEEGNDEAWSMENVATRRYDLITGTPPYFRVGFTSSKNGIESKNSITDNNGNDEVITSAVIQQGGMPTSMQSAPARCEFRGGIEAYCLAAAAMLSQPHGRFFVCENWLNNDRVWKGAKEAGLAVENVWPVMGGAKKESNLFAVYVMKINESQTGEHPVEPDQGCIRPSLIVRDEKGKWTQEYSKVMEAMSIPVI